MGKKIIVIGSPGSGKSTFSRKLRDKSSLPLYYLDMIWHKDDRTNITQEEFDERLLEILERDEWIIDGNYLRNMALRLKYCDQVFFFDLPLEACLQGISSRIGKKREDMPWIEQEMDEEFLDYVKQFPEKKLPQIYELVENSGKDTVIFRSREEADRYIEEYKNE